MENEVMQISEQMYVMGLVDSIVSQKYLSVLSEHPAIDLPDKLDNQKIEDRVAFFEVPKLVFDKHENNLQKLVNVYNSVLGENSGIVMLIKGTVQNGYKMYLGAINDEVGVVRPVTENFAKTLVGNFPGSLYTEGEIELLDTDEMEKLIADCIPVGEGEKYSIASVSGIGSARCENDIENQAFFQGIEKMLDTMHGKEFTALFIATPMSFSDMENIKAEYEEIYSKLSPLSQKQMNFGESQAKSLSVSVSKALSNTLTQTKSSTLGTGTSNTTSHTEGQGITHTDTLGVGGNVGSSNSQSMTDGKFSAVNIGANLGLLGTLIGGAVGSVVPGAGTAAGATIGGMIGSAISGGFSSGKNSSVTNTSGSSTGISGNYSHAIARSKNWSDTTSYGTSTNQSNQVGNSESKGQIDTTSTTRGTTDTTSKGYQITYQNKTIKNILDKLEENFERIKDAQNYGAFAEAAYFLSPNFTDAIMAASAYKGTVSGISTHSQNSNINTWNGNGNDYKGSQILRFLGKIRHPEFAFTKNTDGNPLTVVTPATIVNTKELAIQMSLPKYSVPGITVTEMARFGRNIEKYDEGKDKACVKLGKIRNMGVNESTEVNLSVKSLASHTFITGSTGSGKSNTVYTLLSKCKKKKIKFLVIEPAKGEYKDVFGGMDDVDVYGTNSKLTPQLKINPFSFDTEKIHVYEHMDRLVEIFNVCWPMYAAMPAVLKNAIEKSYEDCGWDLIESTNMYRDKFGKDLFPNFGDVARNIKLIIESSEYDAENKGAYKGALLTRLHSLTNGINGQIFCDKEVKPEDLFDKNVIVDLSRVGSQETKSLLMGMLVLKLQEYRMTQEKGNNELKHITVLEEAHNLLKRAEVHATNESGNLEGKSVEMIANAIAEMRTYGEGFIIVDQAPGLLDMATIRNTNTKIIMRLPDQGDRELVGKAANLNDDQIKELAKLPCGVAAVYQNEWIEPVLCKVEEYKYDKKIRKYDWKKNKDKTCHKMSAKLKLAVIKTILQQQKQEFKIKDLDELGLSSYCKVLVFEAIGNREIKQPVEKMAYVVAEMFPRSAMKLREICRFSKNQTIWKKEVESEIIKETGLSDKDEEIELICNTIFIQVLYNELGKADILEKLYKEVM